MSQPFEDPIVTVEQEELQLVAAAVTNCFEATERVLLVLPGQDKVIVELTLPPL